MIKVVLVFWFSTFLITKIPREGNMFAKKVPSSANSALTVISDTDCILRMKNYGGMTAILCVKTSE